MNKRLKTILITVLISVFCGAIFIGTGYFYLNETLKTTEQKQQSVPYYSVPENVNILFSYRNQKMLAVLNFNEENTTIYLNENSFNGIPYNYTVKANENLLSKIVDVIGGVDIEYENNTVNFTSAQLDELKKEFSNKTQFKKIIAEEIISYFYENGLTESDFLEILSSVETDIKLLDCYTWKNHIKQVCKNLIFVE